VLRAVDSALCFGFRVQGFGSGRLQGSERAKGSGLRVQHGSRSFELMIPHSVSDFEPHIYIYTIRTTYVYTHIYIHMYKALGFPRSPHPKPKPQTPTPNPVCFAYCTVLWGGASLCARQPCKASRTHNFGLMMMEGLGCRGLTWCRVHVVQGLGFKKGTTCSGLKIPHSASS